MAKYLGNRPTAVPLTSADIQDGVITAADLGANSVDSSELVNGSVDLAHLSASGTASSSTFLRGDNSWVAPSGGAALTGSTNNTVTTVTGADAIQGETDLTFNGSLGVGIATPDTSSYFGKVVHIADASNTGIMFNRTDATAAKWSIGCNTAAHLDFVKESDLEMRITSDGDVVIAKTAIASNTVGCQFEAVGMVGATRSGAVAMIAHRLADDGTIIDLRQATTTEGTISVSGTTIAYNTFCGTHWSRLADNSKPTILRGTVMESIATMMTWYQAVADVAEATDGDGNVTPAHKVKESIALPDGKSVGDAVTFTSNGTEHTGVYVKEDNERLPMCKISDTADSKAVYGVFMAWDDQDDGLDGDVNDMYVAALGAFVVRIHKDETVAIGDYLQSNGDGTAKVQADDILRASTIGKVTSTEKTHIHADDSYCVPCTLHCG